MKKILAIFWVSLFASSAYSMNEPLEQQGAWDPESYDSNSAGQLGAGKKMVASYQIPSDAIVVDFGCGTGNLAAQIAQEIVPQGKVFGFDNHAGMIEYAKNKHRHFDHNLTFSKNFFGELPDNSVDYVFAIYSLCWVKKLNGVDGIKAIMQEFARILKPGGMLEARFSIKHTDEHPIAFFHAVQEVASSAKWEHFYGDNVVLANDLDLSDYAESLQQAGLYGKVFIEELAPHACSCQLMTKGLMTLPTVQMIPENCRQELFDDIAQALEKYADKNEQGEFILTGKPCVIKAYKPE